MTSDEPTRPLPDPAAITSKEELARQLALLPGYQRHKVSSLARSSGYSEGSVRNLLQGRRVPARNSMAVVARLLRTLGADEATATGFLDAIRRLQEEQEKARTAPAPSTNPTAGTAPSEGTAPTGDGTPAVTSTPSEPVVGTRVDDPVEAARIDQQLQRIEDAHAGVAGPSQPPPVPPRRAGGDPDHLYRPGWWRSVLVVAAVLVMVSCGGLTAYKMVESYNDPGEQPSATLPRPTTTFDDAPALPEPAPSSSASPSAASVPPTSPAIRTPSAGGTARTEPGSRPSPTRASQPTAVQQPQPITFRITATDGVFERTEPRTEASRGAAHNYGASVGILCQVNNGGWDGQHYASDGSQFRTWAKLSNGNWIYDYWLDTPLVAADGYSPGIPHC
ncbi:helix-turn-helix domain-containing protein [Micromonospora sonneratiae]|uniref:Helix-turn-helix domain-containing protein n=1 Tax=Micromonospora sonneratiae TaxID=1184706 RepID=A0ABW3YBX3_9ACTN